MKKIMIGFFVFVILALSLQFVKVNEFDFLDGYNKILIVTEVELQNQRLLAQNGNNYYYEINDIDSLKEYDYIGVNFYFDKTNLSKLLSSFSNIYRGKVVGTYDIYYGYSVNFKDSVKVDGKKVNVQIVRTENEIIVGFPLILTGY